jgi:hypothetical protein
MAATIKSIKTIVFDGKKSTWEAWHEKFLSLARTKNYRDVLTGVTPIPVKRMTIADPSIIIPFTALEQAVLELNAIAYGDLACSVDTTTQAGLVAFAMITVTKTPDYPDGNCYEAWMRLVDRYQPTSTAELMRKTRKFQEAKLRLGSDPTNFLLYMTQLQIDIKRLDLDAGVTDKLYMSQVINNLTNDYESTVEKLLELLDDGTLTIKRMEDLIQARYDRMSKKEKDSLDIALFAETKKNKIRNKI